MWLAVRTREHGELLARGGLERQGYRTLCLVRWKTVRHARKSERLLRPYFPRYIFVALASGQDPARIKTTPGVESLVMAGEQPLEVPSAVISELVARGDEAGIVQDVSDCAGEEMRFVPGEQVRIANGPLAGLLATVALDKGREVRLWAESLFGQTVPTTAGREQLRRVSP